MCDYNGLRKFQISDHDDPASLLMVQYENNIYLWAPFTVQASLHGLLNKKIYNFAFTLDIFFVGVLFYLKTYHFVPTPIDYPL